MSHFPNVSAVPWNERAPPAGFVFSPTWTGRAIVLIDSASAETKELVRTELGEHVKLIENKTGNMYGQTHAHEFLPNFIGPIQLVAKSKTASPRRKLG